MKYKPEINFIYETTENIFHARIASSSVILEPEEAIGRTFYLYKNYGRQGDFYIDVSHKWGYVHNVLFKILDDSDVNDYYCKVVYMI